MKHRSRLSLALFALLVGGACSSPSGAPDSPAGITVAPHEVQLPVGGTSVLGAVVHDAQGNELRGMPVFWSSSDTALAVVSPSGVVQAKRVGTVKIAASASGSSDVATVVVSPQSVAGITVSPTSAQLVVGGSAQFRAATTGPLGEPLEGRVVSWSSDREAVARVDATGRVTAVGPGAATITATSEGRSASAAVSVTAVPVASVSVSPATLSLTTGQTSQLGADVRDAAGNSLSGRTVVWTSSDLGVVAVGQSGDVRAVGPGSATVTATSEGSSGSAAVTVAAAPPPGPVVASVLVTPANSRIRRGSGVTLTATCLDAGGRTVAGQQIGWSMTATKSGVASFIPINATQIRVQGLAEGTAAFTATCGGKSGSTTVQVTKD